MAISDIDPEDAALLARSKMTPVVYKTPNITVGTAQDRAVTQLINYGSAALTASEKGVLGLSTPNISVKPSAYNPLSGNAFIDAAGSSRGTPVVAAPIAAPKEPTSTAPAASQTKTVSVNSQTTVAPVSSTPQTPTVAAASMAAPSVKTAPIDTVLFDNSSLDSAILFDLIFEDIGGQELINIARNDTVNGQQISYQPIANLSAIQQQYNPNNILNIQATADKYFQNFSIKLDNKIPVVGNGPNGNNVYVEPSTGNIIVESINLDSDEQIEIYVATSGTIDIETFGA